MMGRFSLKAPFEVMPNIELVEGCFIEVAVLAKAIRVSIHKLESVYGTRFIVDIGSRRYIDIYSYGRVVLSDTAKWSIETIRRAMEQFPPQVAAAQPKRAATMTDFNENFSAKVKEMKLYADRIEQAREEDAMNALVSSPAFVARVSVEAQKRVDVEVEVLRGVHFTKLNEDMAKLRDEMMASLCGDALKIIDDVHSKAMKKVNVKFNESDVMVLLNESFKSNDGATPK
jgi:hypothetical protein